MKTFADTVKLLNIERRKNSSGFLKNKRGVLQRTIRASVSILNRTGQTSLGDGLLCYADHDPMEKGSETELIRQRIWQKDQVGWLWAYIKGHTYMLAKISPMGADAFLQGFISETGHIVLKNVDV